MTNLPNEKSIFISRYQMRHTETETETEATKAMATEATKEKYKNEIPIFNCSSVRI